MQPRPDLDQRTDTAVDGDPSRVRIHDAVHETQQRRLAGSVRADEADRLAGFRAQRDILQRPLPTDSVAT